MPPTIQRDILLRFGKQKVLHHYANDMNVNRLLLCNQNLSLPYSSFIITTRSIMRHGSCVSFDFSKIVT